jgi:hypothetical protein
MTERTQEQLDMIYEPLQQKLRDDYDFARALSTVEFPSYLTWLKYKLDGINEEIANLKGQQ